MNHGPCPLHWFGGKASHIGRLLPLFPAHRTYVEPFGGSAAVLLAKKPAPVEVYNDLDSRLVNFFRVLRDEAKAEQLIHLLTLTPYSREERADAHARMLANEGDDVHRAADFFVCTR